MPVGFVAHIEEGNRLLRRQMLRLLSSTVLVSVSKSEHLFSPEFVVALEKYASIPFARLAQADVLPRLVELIERGNI